MVYIPVYNDNEWKGNYWDIKSELIQFKVDVAYYFDMSSSDLKWFHYRKYCEEKMNTVFVTINDETTVDDKIVFNGKTTKKDNTYIVTYNTSPKLNTGRIHYTILHEIAHIILHMKNENSLEMHSAYGFKKDQKEIQADMAASELLIDKDTVVQKIKDGATFIELCDEFEVSYQALSIRLANILMFEYNLAEEASKIFVNGFKFHKPVEGSTNIRIYLSSIEIIKKELSDFWALGYDYSFEEFENDLKTWNLDFFKATGRWMHQLWYYTIISQLNVE